MPLASGSWKYNQDLLRVVVENERGETWAYLQTWDGAGWQVCESGARTCDHILSGIELGALSSLTYVEELHQDVPPLVGADTSDAAGVAAT